MQNQEMENKFENFFYKVKKKCSMHKHKHFFDIYETHFNQFLGKNPKILEIGVGQGGSIEMWNYYFDGECEIYGIDIDPDCLKHQDTLGLKNVDITIGDQESNEFWDNYLFDKPKFDIIIDDGGHTMNQQIVTFENTYEKMSESGVYLCEDVQTSYFHAFGGGYKSEGTFLEYSKNLIDGLNSNYSDHSGGNFIPYNEDRLTAIHKSTKSLTYYNAVLVFQRQKYTEYKDVFSV